MQADLARACKVKPPSVHAWFSGETKKLQAMPLLDAAEFLNVSPRWLATGRGPMRPSLHMVAEPSARYDIWPMSRLSREEYFSLPLKQREQIEQYALLIYRDWHAHQHALTKSAT